MHESQTQFCIGVKNKFPDLFKGLMVDFGSLNVNGTNKHLSEGKYIGVDVVNGDNVDYICKCHEFEMADKETDIRTDELFDVVISTEMLEHDPYVEKSLKNMLSLLKPGGLLLFTCAGKDRPKHGAYEDRHELPKGFPDYYKNLTKEEIETYLNRDLFDDYVIIETGLDLYFYGIKKTGNKVFKPKRKNAVFVACGKDSLHGVYTKKERSFDIIELAYEDSLNIGDYYYRKDGFKFNLAHNFIKENPAASYYEHYIFIDDDVFISKDDIELIFSRAKEYKLDLFHPAMNSKNFEHAPVMFKQPNSLIHNQNWCEITCIGMDSKTLNQLLPSFMATKSGWGLPDIWGHHGKTYNILNEVEAVHTKPMNTGNFYKNLGGIKEAHKEWEEIVKIYPQKEFKISKKIYITPPLSVFTIYREEEKHFLEEYLHCLPNFAQRVLIKTIPLEHWEEHSINDIDNGLPPECYKIRISQDLPDLKTGIMFVPTKMRDREFDKMKEAAKELCTAEWVLNLDIDERLLSHQFDRLREWIEIKDNHRNVGGYYLTSLSLMPSTRDEKTGLSSRVAIPQCRLFRKQYTYDAAVHETVDQSIIDSGYKIMDSTMIIHHMGYEVGKEKLIEKAQRNIEILWMHPELMDKPEKKEYMKNTNVFLKQLEG